MIGRNSLDEALLQRLILHPDDADVEASVALRREARSINDVFVAGLGWDAARLARYRFRDLATLSAEGSVVQARALGGRDVTALGSPEVALEAMKGLSRSQAAAYAEHKLGIGVTVSTILRERGLLLSQEEWTRLDRLVYRYAGGKLGKRRDSRQDYARTLLDMLERAYGG